MSLDLDADRVAETDLATSVDTLSDLSDLSDSAAPASPIKDREDLRRLNRSATQKGMYTGMLGGGVLTFGAHKLKMPKNGLVFTFIMSSTTISFLITRNIIRRTLGAHYEAMRAAQEPVAPGGGMYLDDVAGGGAPKTGSPPPPEAEHSRILRELNSVRTVDAPRERTIWAKGRGLEGEVEEEAEMRDAYLRPGLPRREV